MVRNDGFTLIEILAVLAVMVVVVGMVVVRLDDGGERIVRQGAEKLGIALETARDRAIYESRDIGFSTDGAGFQFWRNDHERRQWMAIGDDDILRTGRLPGEVRIVAQTLNGKPRPLGERLVFSAEGLSEPFSLGLEQGQTRLWVNGDVLGRITIGNRPDETDGTAGQSAMLPATGRLPPRAGPTELAATDNPPFVPGMPSGTPLPRASAAPLGRIGPGSLAGETGGPVEH